MTFLDLEYKAVERPEKGGTEAEEDDPRIVVEHKDTVEDHERYSDECEHGSDEEACGQFLGAPEDAVDEGGEYRAGADDEGYGGGVVGELDGIVLAKEVEGASGYAEKDEQAFVAP